MVNDQTPPSATREAVNGLCQASYVIGIVAAIGLLIPPGLIIGPPAGLAAVILGMAGLSDAPEGSKSRTRAITGVTLGAVALFVELSLIFLFRHVIWRAIGPLL